MSVCTCDRSHFLSDCCPMFGETKACFCCSDLIKDEEENLDKTIGYVAPLSMLTLM